MTQNLSNGRAVAAECHSIGVLDLKITINIFFIQNYNNIFNINEDMKID